MRFFRALTQRWRWFYGLGAVLLLLFGLAFLFLAPQPNDTSVFYALVNGDHSVNLIYIPVVLMILGIALYISHTRQVKRGLLFYLVTMIIGTAALVVGMGISNAYVAAVDANGSRYNLVKYPVASDRSVLGIALAYVLYQCDPLGVTCSTLFHYPGTQEIPLDLWEPALTVENGTVTLKMDGVVVYPEVTF
jgi:hypothetical protein